MTANNVLIAITKVNWLRSVICDKLTQNKESRLQLCRSCTAITTIDPWNVKGLCIFDVTLSRIIPSQIFIAVHARLLARRLARALPHAPLRNPTPVPTAGAFRPYLDVKKTNDPISLIGFSRATVYVRPTRIHPEQSGGPTLTGHHGVCVFSLTHWHQSQILLQFVNSSQHKVAGVRCLIWRLMSHGDYFLFLKWSFQVKYHAMNTNNNVITDEWPIL